MPSIPVGTQASTHATGLVDFTCRRCGHHANAEVTGIGEGAQSFINAPGTAEARARADAQKDIQRTIRRARCPQCGRRNPGVLLGFLTPYLLMTAAFLAAGIVAGYAPTWFDMNMAQRDRDICKWVMPLIIAVPLLLIVPLSALPKWASTDARIRFLR